MHDFYGTAHLLEDPGSGFDAKVTVDLNKVTIQADNAEIGSWRHADVNVQPRGSQVQLTADGETLVLELEGQDFFMDLLGVEADAGKKKSRRRRKTPDYEQEKESRTFSLADTKQQQRDQAADRIDRRLALVMVVASAVILAGAALTWGPFRLVDGDFPISRLLAGFGGLAGLLAVYLAYFDRNRFVGSAAATTAGVITLCIAFLYAREARLGIGFFVAMLGSQALIAAGVFGLRGGRPTDTERKETNDVEEGAS